mgnify:CR=1 FL=1
MASRDKPSRTERVSLTVIEGARHQKEEELLREFLRPGVSNLRRIKLLASRLRSRDRFEATNTS